MPERVEQGIADVQGRERNPGISTRIIPNAIFMMRIPTRVIPDKVARNLWKRRVLAVEVTRNPSKGVPRSSQSV